MPPISGGGFDTGVSRNKGFKRMRGDIMQRFITLIGLGLGLALGGGMAYGFFSSEVVIGRVLTRRYWVSY